MWTSTLELKPSHVLLTQLLGRFWHGAYFSPFAPLQVRNLPRQPLPASNWVRVRNNLAGICGSDLHLIYADGDFRIAPAALPSHKRSYPGHEVVGEVIEVGDDVQQVRVGDRVAFQHGPNCVSCRVADVWGISRQDAEEPAQPLCRSCAAGNYNLCERGDLPGPQPLGGGWSEEMLLHENQVFRVPGTINDEQAVLLEPSAVALHAVLRHLPHPSDRVLVIGAGTIGLLIVQIIRTLAPQVEISVQARYPFQIEQATRMGAAHIIYPQDSYKEVQQATKAQLYQGMMGNKMLLGGYDVIYDTVGSTHTTSDALRWACAGATVVMVGLSLHKMHIDLTPIWYQEVSLIGTMAHGTEVWPIGTSETMSTFAIVAEMIERRELHPEHLITHRFALTNYRNAIMTATHKAQSRAMKVVFDYSLLPASVVPNVRAATRQRRLVTTNAQFIAPLAERRESLETSDKEEQFMVLNEKKRDASGFSKASAVPVPVAPALSAMLPPPPFIEDDDEDARTLVVSKEALREYRPGPLPTSESGQEEDETATNVVLPDESMPASWGDVDEGVGDEDNWISSFHILGEQVEDSEHAYDAQFLDLVPNEQKQLYLDDEPMPPTITQQPLETESVTNYRGRALSDVEETLCTDEEVPLHIEGENEISTTS